ncbi:MAG: hypothetical protein ACYTDY_04690 [Planctomycetota bacterium]|jgi:hypothetical protein
MECPICKSTMVRGRFGSHGQAWHVQAYGPFGLPLAFAPEAGEPTTCFSGTRDGQDGLVCERCRSVILVEPPPEEVGEDWECPACGRIVPGKFDTCWYCQQRRPGRLRA